VARCFMVVPGKLSRAQHGRCRDHAVLSEDFGAHSAFGCNSGLSRQSFPRAFPLRAPSVNKRERVKGDRARISQPQTATEVEAALEPASARVNAKDTTRGQRTILSSARCPDEDVPFSVGPAPDNRACLETPRASCDSRGASIVAHSACAPHPGTAAQMSFSRDALKEARRSKSAETR
jgi:hypothetical protein